MKSAMRIATPEEIRRRFPGEISKVKLYITLDALKAIADTVGAKRPETGAKLFGPIDGHGIDVVEFDYNGSAKAGSTIYRPDAKWGAGRVEHHLHRAKHNRVWHGDVHSHPGGLGRPSGVAGPAQGDLGYAKEVLAQNPWMQDYFIPIVTNSFGEKVLWSWVVHRDEPTRARIAEVVVTEPENFPPRRFAPEWEKANTTQSEDQDISVPEYPEAPKPYEEPEPGFKVPQPLRPLTLSQAEYRKRLEGVVSPSITDKHIAVVGVGAASTLTDTLVRHGVGKVTIFDPDVIEFGNLCRTAYTVSDVGLPKVGALAVKLRQANPFLTVQPMQADFCKLPDGLLAELIGDADLIIAATDQLEAQAAVNSFAIENDVPAIFIDIHAGGRGGMVVWTMPKQNACYRCIAARRFESSAVTELPAERASMVDIGFVDHIAMKLSLAILEREQDSAMGRFFERLDVERNQVVVRTDPSYAWGEIDLFNLVLADLSDEQQESLKAQAYFALDSLWLKTEKVSCCPACGERHAVA
jgi:hypothetical protein